MRRFPRIGLFGMEEAPGFVAAELRGIGVDAVELNSLSFKALRGIDLLHVFFPPMAGAGFQRAKLLGVKTIAHWFGTDVEMVKQGRNRLWERLSRPFVDLHLAVHRPLVEELAELGISTRYLPNLSTYLRAELLPLPSSPTILCYTPAERPELYGVERLLRLARRLPDVSFISCGAEQPPHDTPPNWKHLGNVSEMRPLYEQARVLVRPTRRDGLCRMVLESLGYGRQVVWTQPFPAVHYASNDAELLATTKHALNAGINQAGYELIRSQFDRRRNSYRLAEIYRSLLGRAVIASTSAPVKAIEKEPSR